jgi:hypothetical protein
MAIGDWSNSTPSIVEDGAQVGADSWRRTIPRSTPVPGIRTAGAPDYLLSSFINGIKHLPCEFG